MAINEGLTFDTLALNDGTTFTLEALEMPDPAKRPEWITGADADGSALVRDPLFDNREITARVRVEPQASMDLALAKIAQITDKIEEAERQPDGLPLVWTPANSTKTVTFYVLSGSVSGLPIMVNGADAGWFVAAPVITIALQAKPFGYGAEVGPTTAGPNTNAYQTLTLANVPGDVPAEGRLVVTDNATQSRRHVEWGLEQRYYNAATSLELDSDSMVVGAGYAGTQTTRTGAYDPNATGNNVIRVDLGATGYSLVAACGLGNPAHVGTFRIKARVYSTTPLAYLRLAWQDGDGPLRRNDTVQVPAFNNWSEMDLGIITTTEKVLGTQRWTGQLEVSSAFSTSYVAPTFDIDTLWLVPAGEGYGKARSALVPQIGTLAGYDYFDSTVAGNALGTRAAPLGGNWATSGSATDFAFYDDAFGGEAIQRTTTADTGSGRFAILGTTNYTNMEVDAAVIFSPTVSTNIVELAVLARYVDASNFIEAKINTRNLPGRVFSIVERTTAGGAVTLASWQGGINPNQWYSISLTVLSAGSIVAQLIDTASGAVVAELQAASSNAAAGGTLASGKPGLRDQWFSSGACSRNYDGFQVFVAPTEPIVIYSGREIQFRSDEPIRADSTGTYYGVPPSYRGSRFLVPPAGDKNRTSRIFAKARRNDVDVNPDGNIADSTKLDVYYTPRYLRPR